ncbi:MAG: bifunctional phosphopantothenoylcysteine decarboxylase/phosphopantothenate--cysteine ligase CoaBC [Rhodoluna sp.]|nr:bifunctional phosphopantothenoylcysteine decarboxylase/phosphopantothenate--cysteine ligase CoaBC [Rhodoluna sp.]
MARIVLGVTGGIAAYKATAIIRLLTEAGHSVKVIPTQNALRFIGATTLEALSHNAVDPDLYTYVDSVKHIAIAQEADLVIIAPATASFLARFASGVADDLLGNTLLATKAPVLVAPAMHTEMWLNPATQANIATLSARNIAVLEPASGRLTGEDSGVGRLPEPEVIVEAALALLIEQDLMNKHIVVTAGGTQEPIDPVRFIGNHSSGKQGIAIAKAAAQRGATVTLIGANIAEVQARNLTFIRVSDARELQSAVAKTLDTASALIMAAAVSDFRVEHVSAKKLKRAVLGDKINLELTANPDILALSVAHIRAQQLGCITVGFAAETATSESDLRQLAAHKLMSKGCDILVANDVSEGKVFGSEDNSVLILAKSGIERTLSAHKTEVANAILDILIEL